MYTECVSPLYLGAQISKTFHQGVGNWLLWKIFGKTIMGPENSRLHV